MPTPSCLSCTYNLTVVSFLHLYSCCKLCLHLYIFKRSGLESATSCMVWIVVTMAISLTCTFATQSIIFAHFLFIFLQLGWILWFLVWIHYRLILGQLHYQVSSSVNVILFFIIQRLTEALNLLTLGWENLQGVLDDIITSNHAPP